MVLSTHIIAMLSVLSFHTRTPHHGMLVKVF
jgi:hypothetical protein